MSEGYRQYEKTLERMNEYKFRYLEARGDVQLSVLMQVYWYRVIIDEVCWSCSDAKHTVLLNYIVNKNNRIFLCILYTHPFCPGSCYGQETSKQTQLASNLSNCFKMGLYR